MIDLSSLRSWASTLLAVLFFVLWRVSEHKEGRALKIAEDSNETSRACVTGYREYADSIGAAVKRLHPTRVPEGDAGVKL